MLQAFASFGFCKAHAAAFALPTYQSAWLKAHHPAAFLAGVLTHDPGMYPKRLILDDARQCGITVLGLDVNASESTYRVERLEDSPEMGIRLALAEVKGITDDEVARIVAGRPYASLADFWHRAGVSRPVVERLVVAGAFDSLYGLAGDRPAGAGARSPAATCSCRSPTSTAGPGPYAGAASWEPTSSRSTSATHRSRRRRRGCRR